MRKRSTLILGGALAVATVLTAVALFAQEGALREATVDVPRTHQVILDLTFQGAKIYSVESQNDPQPDDIKEAEEKHPKDKTYVLMRFRYSNEDYARHKVKLRAVLLTADDTVVAEGGRSGTLDPKQTSDTISFPIRLKTLDWPRATKMKVTATFIN